MQPSDSLASFGRDFGSPRPRPTSWDRRLFCRLCRRPTHAPANAPVSEMDHRLSVTPVSPEERQGPPGLLDCPLPTRRGATSRRIRLLLAPYFSSRRSTERPPSPSENSDPSASGMNIVFGTTYPRLACSRTYASPVSLPRPSPGSLPARAGSPLAGRVSHPLDRKRNFMESSHTLQSQSTSRASSH
jgi:hypothetical protein